MLLEAFQYDAFLSGAFQSEVATETGYPAFQADAFQFDAFQVEEIVFEEEAKGGLGYGLLLGDRQEFNTFFLGKPPEKREEVLREAYEELIEVAPTAVKKQAGKAVRPFSDGDKRKSIPKPTQIDWTAFERDQVRVAVMLELWQELLIQEEEEILLLLAA